MMPPQYNPKEYEEKIYRRWEEAGVFSPGAKEGGKTETRGKKNPVSVSHKLKAKSFSVVVPPPNVTGSLHMGHALNATIQDILIRKKRMEGYRTLWLPGTDHAGIATQNVVEKELKKEGKTRHDIGREALLKRIWEWKEKYGVIILDQFKKLGVSMDWSRTRFTMDAPYQKAVEEAFVFYYKKGWIYRAERVVNWCPRCQTSLSDLELEHKEEQTTLYYIRYPFVEKFKTQNPKPKTDSEFVVVATTRPETMLGDAAVAVNPKDTRYKKFVGKKVLLPIQNREIPIVADSAVEMSFGTGVVKVTPSHDMLDAEIAERHNLPRYTVINKYGKMTEAAGPLYEGLKTRECREKIVAELRSEGFLEKEEPYTHNVSLCYRCGSVIEPLPSLQWFLKMRDLAKTAMDAVKKKQVVFHPARWQKPYLDWLKNIKDWCISRQIWWGHRIPVSYCVACGDIKVKPEVKSHWFFVRHGQTDWNAEHRVQGQTGDSHLNENGKAQARQAGEILKNYQVDLIISSDSFRAKETAEAIAEATKAELVLDPSLRERHLGVFEGKTRDEIMASEGKAVYEQAKNDHLFIPPNGESLKSVEKRIQEALARHKGRHSHKNVVVVSHGATLKVVMTAVRKLGLEGFAAVPHMGNTEIAKFSIAKNPCSCGSDFMEEETDVLDTWFSSALWPFATLGWPSVCAQNQTSNIKNQNYCVPESGTDLAEFYPTSVLSTARDIINLWVGRMVFSGVMFMGKPPFKDVIIHPTILTKEGKRMSKSLGTGIDPLTLIEKYGADATRFGLIWQTMGTQDIHWSEEHVVAGKKFANKMWNAARFVLSQTQSSQFQAPGIIKSITVADKKILAARKAVIKTFDADIKKYEFGQALHALYDFFWHEFCDMYIEAAKSQLTDEKTRENTEHILLFVLSDSLKLLHPFMPFVTEAVWEEASGGKQNLLMVAEWPAARS